MPLLTFELGINFHINVGLESNRWKWPRTNNWWYRIHTALVWIHTLQFKWAGGEMTCLWLLESISMRRLGARSRLFGSTLIAAPRTCIQCPQIRYRGPKEPPMSYKNRKWMHVNCLLYWQWAWGGYHTFDLLTRLTLDKPQESYPNSIVCLCENMKSTKQWGEQLNLVPVIIIYGALNFGQELHQLV